MRIAPALTCAAILGCASMVQAGENAGGTARMYWVTGANAKAAYRDETACTPKLAITAVGLVNFRGANVQILMGSDSGTLAPSWQFQAGGCAEVGAATFSRSGFPAGVPSAWEGLPGVADAQSSMYYNISSCLTPHGTGVIWLQSAATAASIKTRTTEYGIYVVTVDQSSGLCAGGCGDSLGPAGVCLDLNLRDPCPNPTTSGNLIQVLDGNFGVDNLPAVPGFDWLTWNSPGGIYIDLHTGKCYLPGAARTTTWGQLRKTYR